MKVQKYNKQKYKKILGMSMLGFLALYTVFSVLVSQYSDNLPFFSTMFWASLLLVLAYSAFGLSFYFSKINAKQKELVAKNREIEVILNSVNAFISFKDTENRFYNLNETMARKMGKPREELIGASLYDLLPFDVAKSYHDDDLRIIQSGKTEANILEKVTLGDKDYWLRNSKTPVFDEIGKPIGLVIYAEDVTAEIESRRKLELNEQQLLKYSHQLEESNQNLQEFAYVISHDLREPLRTITSYTQLLKRYLKPEDQGQNIQDFMYFIVDATKRMDGQINGILEYSRVGRANLEYESVSIEEVLGTVQRSLNAIIEETGASVQLRSEGQWVVADKMQLTMLFQNLISNALKYRKTEVTPIVEVDIEVGEDGNFWQIVVEDNGIGIESQYLDKIFGVFRRLHTRKDIEGTGIGLSISKRIVQRHSGKIWVESEFGQGTKVFFTLPIRPE